MIFMGLTIKIEGLYYLKNFGDLFVLTGLGLLFLSFVFPIVYTIKVNLESSSGSLKSFLSPLDILFLGISMIVFVVYRDIILSIAIFLVLYAAIRIINKQ